MNKELYVSSTPHETKVAMVEDDQLAEVFFERENEYTLAGSIYKGRVTRVLPGMQSAFVDIGLERDAFLYVSDFMEVGDEEDEEFGEIPAPRTAIDFSRSQPDLARSSGEIDNETTAGLQGEAASAIEDDAVQEGDLEMEGEADDTEESSGEAAGNGQETSEGVRRWKGRRRRRGGRRGRGEDRFERPEVKSENNVPVRATESEPQDTRPAARSTARPDYVPPPAYTPIVLPGESISKYRNAAQPVASEQSRVPQTSELEQPQEPAANKEITYGGERSTAEAHHLATEVAAAPANDVSTEQMLAEAAGHAATEPEQLERAAAGFARERHTEHHDMPAHQSSAEIASAQVSLENAPAVESSTESSSEFKNGSWSPEVFQAAEAEVSRFDHPHQAHVASEDTAGESADWASADESPEGLPEADSNHEPPTQEFAEQSEVPAPFVQHHEAPSEAPEGRTLEHEVLEDDEMEFHPVPENIEALSEVAGDEELVLEEETIDRDTQGFAERWVPQIADVDEDEVVAAEERGETVFENAEENEEEDFEEEEVNGRAEVRAPAATAAYQQRYAERPTYDRRGQRGRRNGGRRNNLRPRPGSHRPQPLISDLLKEGQEILIQIAKEPIGKKGARITSHIALPGRFLVYMPTVNHVGVSRKIASDEERQRLKRIVVSERENGIGGFIVRTAAANIKEDELRADIRFLKHLWAEIKTRAENSKPPALIYHDLNLVERVLRDQVNADFSQIWVDTEEQYERVVRFASRFQPSLVKRIKLYTKDAPLFEQFGIQEEIDKSLKSKVWLKSGGYLVINQTEALVAIDINTGKYVGKTQRLEDTIVKTNVDAVKEIVRQIRLRDLGGIIVIDFIDMDERKNRQKVMQALDEALRWDRAPSKVLQFNDFGLVAITRKRVKQSLERTLGEPCPYCTGAGFVKSVITVSNELYTEMRKMAKQHDRSDITVRVNPEVAKALKANNGKLIAELEELTGKTVLIKSDNSLHQEQFDII